MVPLNGKLRLPPCLVVFLRSLNLLQKKEEISLLSRVLGLDYPGEIGLLSLMGAERTRRAQQYLRVTISSCDS
jgi:hypothetical protein